MSVLRSPAVRIAGIVILILILLAALWVAWRLFDRDPTSHAPDVAVTPELIARGEYVATLADCEACHTIKGGQRFAGGRAFTLPFGTIYSTNITADRETGIGSWSDDDFVRALHTGVAKNGQNLYPAFPYTSYSALSREDAVAIKAWLFSLPKVHAPAPRNTLGFPFNQRWGMALWNLAFLDQHRFRPDPKLSAQQNRGAYLAGALGHCGECHTPRNFAFAMKTGENLAGETLVGWRAYNITSDKQFGVGGWDDAALTSYLTTGHAEGHGGAAGPMAEAIEFSLQHWKPEDIAALVAYLRTVPPQRGSGSFEVDPAAKAMTASTGFAPAAGGAAGLGQRVFEGACASCHQWNGLGQQTRYAELKGSQTVNDPRGTNLVQVVLHGIDLRSVNGEAWMPAFGAAYSDAEVAAVANFVIGHFGGKTGKVTPAQVERARQIAH